MKKILYIVAALLTFSACSIDRFPKGSIDSGKIEDDPATYLPYLMNGCYSQLKGWSDVMHRCGEYAGDNITIRGSSTDAFYEFISFQRTPQNYRLQTFWDNSYKIIAQSSNVIKQFEEGKDAKVDHNLGECYFLRGMMYFYLCRAYGRPYFDHPEKNLGVPIVNGTPEDMDNLQLPDRSTVKETYEQVIGDLKKAEELLQEHKKGPGYASKEAAQALLSRVYLYMSGTYENPNVEYAQKSVDYANKVIDSGKFELLDRNAFMKYNTELPEKNKESIFVVKRLASEFSGYDHFYGVGGMYANIGGMGWGEMYASAKYLDLLDETGRNDWRPNSYRLVDARAAFIAPQYRKVDGEIQTDKYLRIVKEVYPARPHAEQSGFTYAQLEVKEEGNQLYAIEVLTKYTSATDEKGNYIPEKVKNSEGKEVNATIEMKYPILAVDEDQEVYKIEHYNTANNIDPKEMELTGVIDYYISLNRAAPMFYIEKCSKEGEDSHLHSPIITRLGEVYLNRAEAYAKLGKYTDALKDLNKIRERSIPGAGYADLDASNAGERIDKERQLELAYQAERSYDVFRNGKSLERRYPGPHYAMEDIPATDYRVIYFIPQDAINSYSGTLTQNPTSN